jgi:hypothetical protein
MRKNNKCSAKSPASQFYANGFQPLIMQLNTLYQLSISGAFQIDAWNGFIKPAIVGLCVPSAGGAK